MIFTSALRRLTVVYSLIQLAVIAALAIGVYIFVTGTFDFDAATQDGAAAVGAAERGFELLRIALIAGFAILCVVVPFTSYWMARVALNPLKLSYERQQQFVDDASHEMRGPLSIIRGELELTQTRRRTEQDYRRAITRSLEATQTLVHITEDLLLLARDSTAELETRFGPVTGDEIVRSAISALSSESRTRLVTQSNAPATIDGISSLLVRALTNILDNAMKFAPEGGTVVLTAISGANEVTFRVEDHGIGMEPNEIRHVFERFWRAPNSNGIPGHGLGLALVDRIARVHHGRVKFTSTVGVGSIVTLAVPLARPSPRTTHDTHQPAPHS